SRSPLSRAPCTGRFQWTVSFRPNSTRPSQSLSAASMPLARPRGGFPRMLRQPHTSSREIIVANAIREVVNELRLVDPADYIALIRLESMASLSDIVMSAAELYLMPGTLGLGHGSEVHISWTEPPRIVLDLELRPK